MNRRKVSVIILNWNGREVLGPCLESLMRVTDPQLDVIVVDNGSNDGEDGLVLPLLVIGTAIGLVVVASIVLKFRRKEPF